MKTRKITLCPQCGECPSVEITPTGVTIGEDDTTVTLTHDQWNDLVDRILEGEIGRIS